MSTIHDVARASGVSISTVSYALSGKRSVSESTRRRIDKAVRDLDYRPNAGARMLKGTRAQILAVSAPLHEDTYTPAHMTFVHSVVIAARAYDYDILLLTQDEATSGLRRVARSKLVDGIILLDVSQHDGRSELVRELGLPSTHIGLPLDTEGLTCVDLNFERAAELAVQRLHRQGHRSIGLFGQQQMLYERGSNFPPRFRDAFLAEADRLGLAVAFFPSDEDAASVRETFDELSRRLPEMSALVLNCNENVHMTLLELLRTRRIGIPDDLSIVSACSSFDSGRLNPPLDLIPLPAEKTCTRAVQLTVAALSGEPAEPHVELIDPTYIEKGSTTARIA